MSELQEATKEFLIESHENLDQLDLDLVGLEKSAAPTEAVARIFRTLHTLKGSCAFLSFARLEAVAHAGESLLGKLRDGKLTLTPEITDGLLRMVDAIRKMLSSIEDEGHDGAAEPTALIALLKQLANPPLTKTVHASSTSGLAGAAVDFSLSGNVTATVSAQTATSVEQAPPAESSAVYDASVRINVELLDKLMAIAGEVVLARNQILQYSQQHGDPAFQNTCRQLNLITTELQEHVMKTRLQPLGNVWNRFPRLVHDSAQACGKLVRFETEGSETELDKSMLEAIRDPLTHLIRNAIDHGIESSERRRAAGKPAEGCVRLRAYHEGGQVNIEVSDDGGGIDPERIKQRAVEQRLLTADQVSHMGSQSVLGLIFLPGFSTAAAVTTVSGRGVGMDVVKTNIEKIGGAVDVQSRIGQGTTVRIRIPLTLAILQVLVVTSGGDHYAIPRVSIVELVRVEGEKRKSIQRAHGAQVHRYRDRLLPLVNLNQTLNLTAPDPARVGADDAVNIVVLQAADQQFGLVVDKINDTQEIVVKPLWKHLKGLACFAGATVMGNGQVSLILDVFGLAQHAGVGASVQKVAMPEAPAAPQRAAERASVLLCEARDRSRLAIPLNQVARLEKFPLDRVESVGGRDVVQYGGAIMPLFDLNEGLAASSQASAARLARHKDTVEVVVCAGDRNVGLVVERILDIVECDGATTGQPARPGIRRATVIQGQVAELVDVDALLGARQEGQT